MTGQELFAALSYVDEKYIQEAETAIIGRNTPWMKVLSVAACLCILITGVYAYGRMQEKTSMDMAPEAVAPGNREPEAAKPEKMPLWDGVVTDSQCEAPDEAPDEASEEDGTDNMGTEGKIPGQCHEIPYALLRVTNIETDGSIAAIVEGVSAEETFFETEMQVSVVIDPDKVPDREQIDHSYAEIVTPDMMIEIRYGIYDYGLNILYVEGVYAAE